MLAGALHHQAMLNSLWQQQQVHDQWEYRSLKNWCFKKGYAMRDAPNNRPNFYCPPLEPFFPWPHAMLQSGVTFEEATGHPRTLFGDAGLGGINVEGTRAALLAYEPNPATLWPYYKRKGPDPNVQLRAPWTISGPWKTQQEVADHTNFRTHHVQVLPPHTTYYYTP